MYWPWGLTPSRTSGPSKLSYTMDAFQLQVVMVDCRLRVTFRTDRHGGWVFN